MKKLLLILLICSGCSMYRIYPLLDVIDIPEIGTEYLSWHQAGQWVENYGLYTDTVCAGSKLNLTVTKLSDPITLDWVTQVQKENNLPVHPFTHQTTGYESDYRYRPPFHLQVSCPFLYRADVIESVWLLNRCDQDSTCELDLFESGQGDFYPRLWCASHFAGLNYQNRAMQSFKVLFPPERTNQTDIYVYPDSCIRYINGRRIGKTVRNMNYDFCILATLIVLNDKAGDVNWPVEINIEKL